MRRSQREIALGSIGVTIPRRNIITRTLGVRVDAHTYQAIERRGLSRGVTVTEAARELLLHGIEAESTSQPMAEHGAGMAIR